MGMTFGFLNRLSFSRKEMCIHMCREIKHVMMLFFSVLAAIQDLMLFSEPLSFSLFVYHIKLKNVVVSLKTLVVV